MDLKFLGSPSKAATWCEEQRASRLSLGMVPTMGALHAGHAALVERAASENDRCVVSIFVNPLQFNEASDYEAYPKDLTEDLHLLEASGCDMAFTGTLLEFFPEVEAPHDIRLQDPGPFAEGLEGDFRPGHFAGVRTIVERLFETVRPDRAYFGEKDFQQTLVVKDLAKRLGYPEIVVCATARETDGLAMSSRNRRLSSRDRPDAGTIYRALVAAKRAWRDGERQPAALSAVMLEVLAKSALEVEYAEVRDPLIWSKPVPDQPLERAQALIAARCGSVRLIDNLALDPEPR